MNLWLTGNWGGKGIVLFLKSFSAVNCQWTLSHCITGHQCKMMLVYFDLTLWTVFYMVSHCETTI